MPRERAVRQLRSTATGSTNYLVNFSGFCCCCCCCWVPHSIPYSFGSWLMAAGTLSCTNILFGLVIFIFPFGELSVLEYFFFNLYFLEPDRLGSVDEPIIIHIHAHFYAKPEAITAPPEHTHSSSHA